MNPSHIEPKTNFKLSPIRKRNEQSESTNQNKTLENSERLDKFLNSNVKIDLPKTKIISKLPQVKSINIKPVEENLQTRNNPSVISVSEQITARANDM